MSRLILSLSVLLLLTAAGPGRSAPAPTLQIDDFGRVEDFRLEDQRGEPVSRADLRGKVWVASFFFSQCPDCAGKHLPNLRRLYDELAGYPDVVLVSFSVNPLEDTPEQLADYAGQFDIDPARWVLLRGPEDDIYALAEKSFYQGVAKKADSVALAAGTVVAAAAGPRLAAANTGATALDAASAAYADIASGRKVGHSFRLLVVDPQGEIRGYVDGADASEVDQLPDRIRHLLQADRLESGYYFPTLNAALNGLSGLLLVVGYVAIRRRAVTFHKVCMLAALVVSAVFLGCYLYYHLVIRDGTPTRFIGGGWVKSAYLGVLLSHTVLAVVVTPMALIASYLGLRDRLAAHVRLARWTFPLWLYVSVTGVVVYWLLYHL